MLSKNIHLKNFELKKKDNPKIKKDLRLLLKEKNIVIKSLTPFYRNSFTKNNIFKLKKSNNFRVIGMGGSTLGVEAIYSFLKKK